MTRSLPVLFDLGTGRSQNGDDVALGEIFREAYDP